MNAIEKRIKQLAESANINPVYKYDLIHCMKKIVQEQQKELIEKASELDEAKEIQVMQKMVKQREDARSQYVEAGRTELAKNEFEEMEIIKEFLPKPVSREEIFEYVDSLDKSLQIGGMIKMTKVKYPSADGKLIAEIVKNCLK